MVDCSKCTRTDVKCCFTCKKDADKCKVWHHCGSDCSEHESRIHSNADRIRSMSDEELAEFLPVVFDCMCNPTEKCMKNTFVRGECTKTIKCALRWLQSEAE
jgi:hypothetical protein